MQPPGARIRLDHRLTGGGTSASALRRMDPPPLAKMDPGAGVANAASCSAVLGRGKGRLRHHFALAPPCARRRGVGSYVRDAPLCDLASRWVRLS